jgi:diadenosine tetraphosphate (Ap4A) HIT family hydrolase
VLETPHWVIEHVHPTSVKGWLVIVLNRHCSALHQLTADEFTELGRLMQALCRALHEILDTQKEYVIQFAEGEGFSHVHFHIIARLHDWPEFLTGSRVFSGLGQKVENPLSSEDLAPLVMKIRDHVLEHMPGELLDKDELSEEMMRELQESRAEVARGELIPWEEVRRELANE